MDVIAKIKLSKGTKRKQLGLRMKNETYDKLLKAFFDFYSEYKKSIGE